MSHQREEQSGFTLIELLIVVIIIGILAAIATGAYAKQREQTKKAACRADMAQIETAERSYILAHGTASPDMQTLVTEHYLDRVPACPGGGSYSWASDADGDVQLLCTVHGDVAGSLSTPLATFKSQTGYLVALLLNYYAVHHSWPRSWSPYCYTDLGLDPAAYASAMDHVFYKVGGTNVAVRPEAGWAMTVTDVNGVKRVMTNNLSWNIVYDGTSGKWYYHTIDPANEVDISTMSVAPH